MSSRSCICGSTASRLTEVRPAVEEIAGAVRPRRLAPPPLISGTVDPSIGVEVTTLQIAALVAAVAGALVVATAFGRQASSISPRPRRRRGARFDAVAAREWNVARAGPGRDRRRRRRPVVAWGLSAFFPRGVARLADPRSWPSLRCQDDSPRCQSSPSPSHHSQSPDRRTGRDAAGERRPPDPGSGWRPVARLAGAAPRRVVRRGSDGHWPPLPCRWRVATMAAITLGVAAVVTVATLEASRAHLATSPRLFGAPAALRLREQRDVRRRRGRRRDAGHRRCRRRHPSDRSRRGHGGGDRAGRSGWRSCQRPTRPGAASPSHRSSAAGTRRAPTRSRSARRPPKSLGAGIGDTVRLVPVGGGERVGPPCERHGRVVGLGRSGNTPSS